MMMNWLFRGKVLALSFGDGLILKRQTWSRKMRYVDTAGKNESETKERVKYDKNISSHISSRSRVQ